MVLLSSGELITLSFPSGYPISPTNQLHPSVSFVHPFSMCHLSNVHAGSPCSRSAIKASRYLKEEPRRRDLGKDLKREP
ncbi:hypothetical protein LB505_000380 [Fusarium chuoi]|nr:hypothetical protein LB505_000380 [Fusarium chuoi]